MKKFVSMMMAALMVAGCLSVNTFAAAVNTESSTTKDVTASYVAATDNDVYKADITWGGMEFKYTGAARTWNPESHSWNTDTAAAWAVADNSTNTIEITNHSSKDITATFSFDTENGLGVTGGTFSGEKLSENKVTVGNALEGSAVDVTVTFMPSGAITATPASDGKIGTITVTLE